MSEQVLYKNLDFTLKQVTKFEFKIPIESLIHQTLLSYNDIIKDSIGEDVYKAHASMLHELINLLDITKSTKEILDNLKRIFKDGHAPSVLPSQVMHALNDSLNKNDIVDLIIIVKDDVKIRIQYHEINW